MNKKQISMIIINLIILVLSICAISTLKKGYTGPLSLYEISTYTNILMFVSIVVLIVSCVYVQMPKIAITLSKIILLCSVLYSLSCSITSICCVPYYRYSTEMHSTKSITATSLFGVVLFVAIFSFIYSNKKTVEEPEKAIDNYVATQVEETLNLPTDSIYVSEMVGVGLWTSICVYFANLFGVQSQNYIRKMNLLNRRIMLALSAKTKALGYDKFTNVKISISGLTATATATVIKQK